MEETQVTELCLCGAALPAPGDPFCPSCLAMMPHMLKLAMSGSGRDEAIRTAREELRQRLGIASASIKVRVIRSFRRRAGIQAVGTVLDLPPVEAAFLIESKKAVLFTEHRANIERTESEPAAAEEVPSGN